MKTSIQNFAFAWLVIAAVASAQPGSCTTDPFLRPEPSLWRLENGIPAVDVPIVWYDPATGILGIDTFGADRIASTTTGTMIDGDDLGFTGLGFRSSEPISALLDGFVPNPSYGAVVWTPQYFAGNIALAGTAVSAEYLEVGCTPLFQLVPGLSEPDFSFVAATFRAAAGVQGFSMFGRVQLAFAHDPGDFDDDGSYTCRDIDALTVAIASGSFVRQFDLNFDDVLDTADRDEWLALAGAAPGSPTGGNPFLTADANLNGLVDVSDFNVWQAHKFTTGKAWCTGDFSADGVTDVQDFALWNENKFTQSLVTVPEPSTATLSMAALVGWFAIWSRAKRRGAFLWSAVARYRFHFFSLECDRAKCSRHRLVACQFVAPSGTSPNGVDLRPLRACRLSIYSRLTAQENDCVTGERSFTIFLSAYIPDRMTALLPAARFH